MDAEREDGDAMTLLVVNDTEVFVTVGVDTHLSVVC